MCRDLLWRTRAQRHSEVSTSLFCLPEASWHLELSFTTFEFVAQPSAKSNFQPRESASLSLLCFWKLEWLFLPVNRGMETVSIYLCIYIYMPTIQRCLFRKSACQEQKPWQGNLTSYHEFWFIPMINLAENAHVLRTLECSAKVWTLDLDLECLIRATRPSFTCRDKPKGHVFHHWSKTRPTFWSM